DGGDLLPGEADQLNDLGMFGRLRRRLPFAGGDEDLAGVLGRGVDLLQHLPDLPGTVGGEVAVDLDVAGGSGGVLKVRLEMPDDRLIEGDGVLGRLQRGGGAGVLRVDAPAEMDDVVGADPPGRAIGVVSLPDLVVEGEAVGVLLDPGDVPPADPLDAFDTGGGRAAADDLGEGVAVDQPVDHQTPPESELGEADRMVEDPVELHGRRPRAPGGDVGTDPSTFAGFVEGVDVRGEAGEVLCELRDGRIDPGIREEDPPIGGVSLESLGRDEGNVTQYRRGPPEISGGFGGSDPLRSEVLGAGDGPAAQNGGDQHLKHRNLLDEDGDEVVLGGRQELPAHTERHGDQGRNVGGGRL